MSEEQAKEGKPNLISKGPFHGRSELVNGRIMWAVFAKTEQIPDLLIAYFDSHSDAKEFIKLGEVTHAPKTEVL